MVASTKRREFRLGNRRSRLALVFFLQLAMAGTTPAQQHEISPQKRAQIESAVSKFMTDTHLPGLSVGVVENGEYEWASGFGLADVENNVPASEHTLFRLASISKSLTATAAMELQERGQLDLDAPVQKYCPAFPHKPCVLTAPLAMSHLAGIPHYQV